MILSHCKTRLFFLLGRIQQIPPYKSRTDLNVYETRFLLVGEARKLSSIFSYCLILNLIQCCKARLL